MKKLQRRISIAWLLLVATTFVIACATKPPPAQEAESPGIATPSPLSGLAIPDLKEREETWQKEWEKMVKAAQREGTMVLYSAEGGELRSILIEFFKSKYNIKLDYVAARGPELAAKIISERNAGIFLVDVLIGAGAPAAAGLKPMGAFDTMEPAIIMPEVKEPQNWYGGKIPWMDPKERTAFAFLLQPSIHLTINTNLVKPGEISSYNDILNPKWKGKILLADPIAPGSFTAWVGLVAEHLMGIDYLRRLAGQEPVAVENIRLQAEWLAQGKYAIGIAIRDTMIKQFQEAGAPLEQMIPREGTQMTAGSGQLRLMNGAPHPNAARLFINWFLSKEGQTIYSKATNEQSAREDVSVDHINPKFRRQPEIKYIINNTEEYLLASREREKLSKEIFGHLVR